MRHVLGRVDGEADWRSCHSIRRSVQWDERGQEGHDEAHPDERLPRHHAFLLKIDGQAAGTARLDDLGDRTGIVRLVAVPAHLRGRGHGRVLDAMVERYAHQLGIEVLLVNAATDAEGFYAATGWRRFASVPPAALEAVEGCVRMWKETARRGLP